MKNFKTKYNKELLKSAILNNDVILAKELIDSGTCSLKDFDDHDCSKWLVIYHSDNGLSVAMSDYLYKEALKVASSSGSKAECDALVYVRQHLGYLYDSGLAFYDNKDGSWKEGNWRRAKESESEDCFYLKQTQYDEEIQDDF